MYRVDEDETLSVLLLPKKVITFIKKKNNIKLQTNTLFVSLRF